MRSSLIPATSLYLQSHGALLNLLLKTITETLIRTKLALQGERKHFMDKKESHIYVNY